MSVSTRLSSFLLATSLLAGACTPALRGNHDAGPVKPIAIKPIKPIDLRPVQPEIDRERLRAVLAARRQASYQNFLSYRDSQIYPVNTFNNGFEHVWLDAFGNLCAAATLISFDWGRSASERIALENNFIRMADVKDGPLMDWMLTSGLTHHEIVAIQAPGFVGGEDRWNLQPEPQDPVRAAEVARLYGLYVDVDRQLISMWEESLDDATDDLMERPELARQLLDGVAAGPGRYGDSMMPEPPAAEPVTIGFAQPPPA